jgi:hypothetical protein
VFDSPLLAAHFGAEIDRLWKGAELGLTPLPPGQPPSVDSVEPQNTTSGDSHLPSTRLQDPEEPMKTLVKTSGLVKSLANSLLLPAEDTTPAAPVVYTTAIRSEGSLSESLAGITMLANQLGFTQAPETLYAADGLSAAFHADHGDHAISLAVECNPRQQTVALAVSGLNNHETFEAFHQVSRTLFGDC